MGNRLKFRKPEEQKEFIEGVMRASKLKVDGLAAIVGVVPRSFRDWRRGKLCMTEKSVRLFRQRYGVDPPESIETLIGRWKQFKSDMGTRGGFACYKKHGNFSTLEGRRKGGAKTF